MADETDTVVTDTSDDVLKSKSLANLETTASDHAGETDAAIASSETELQAGDEEMEYLLTSDLREAKRSISFTLRNISTSHITDFEEELNPDLFPPSYKNNQGKELKGIQYCTTFLYQYNHLCNHRRPVFLKPQNEFGVEKLVCTAIVPTQLPFKDLLDWADIADFVSGYLKYKTLHPAILLPKTMYAPQTILEQQRGHCFEYSTVLCSMLIGAGYDAFVVSGYATRETCDLNMKYTKCPFVEDDLVVYTRPITLDINRYRVRPARQYKSEFELRMHMKLKAIFKKEEDELFEAKEKARRLNEAPPPDEYHGRRVHSWVMVLKGSRDIDTTFFIEPTTGVAHPTDWEEYLGIETLWNNKNYYINMQQFEISGVANLKFEIGDSRDWEYIFPGQDLHLQLTPEEQTERKLQLSIMGDFCAEELHFDLPRPWSKPLAISRDDYARRYPGGKRARYYKYTVVEDYCRYLNPDGLVRKVRRYSDIPCLEMVYTREMYKDRGDKLEMRFLHVLTGKVIENFAIGRTDFIREHVYLAHAMGPEKWRIIQYEPDKRVDGQIKLEESSSFLKQYFSNRGDKKHYKETQFGPKGKVFESAIHLCPNPRPIETIVECYHRNTETPADSDIARITYTVWIDEIDIEYHIREDRIIFSTRHFSKPPQWWDESQILTWSPDLHWCFKADPFVRPESALDLYQMLIALMDTEAGVRVDIRKMEMEIRETLIVREEEEANFNLLVTYVQADEDEHLREERLKLKAQKKAEMILAKSDNLKDYLEPFMIKAGLPKIANKKQASKIRDDCMLALKERLVCQANIIKESFAKEVQLIETAQLWYHGHFTLMSHTDILDYRTFLIQHTFIAHILERRLISLKEYAPIKYHALFDTLQKDSRLEQFLI